MKTSENGRRFIEAFEGLFLKAYRDSAGVLTIGYGHTSAAGGLRVEPGMRITKEKADELLADDLSRVERRVESCIKRPLTQYEYDALASFDFNTGALISGSVDDKINRGDINAAMATLLQYNHGGGRVLAGLTRRRKAEKLMFEGKVEEAMKLAGTKSITVKAEHIGPVVATGVGAAVAANADKVPHEWMPFVIGGIIGFAVLSYLIFKYIRYRKEK